MNQNEGLLVRAAHFIQDYWPRLASISSTVAFLFASYWFGPILELKNDFFIYYRFWVGVFFVLMCVVGEFGSQKHFGRIALLQKEIESLKKLVKLFGEDYPDIWRARLGVLATGLQFAYTERISVYKPEGEILVMLGRFSHNTEFNRAGRSEYPMKEGCLGRAYQEGKAIVVDLPDPNSGPDEYYNRMEKEWNMSKKLMKKLKMKSRSYAAFALKDETGLNNEAVVVFESTKENGLDVKALEQEMKGRQGQTLVSLMHALSSMEPSVALAKRKGF